MLKRVLPLAAASAAVIGVAGLALIKQSEGVRYRAYRDVVGVWTVCYGHTGPDIIHTKLYTEAECNTILLSDIRKHQVVIVPGSPRNCIRNAPLTANQRDAVTSFIINVGTTAFCKSTMAKQIAARDYYAAGNQFPRWNKAGGKVWPGLTKRRAAERDLFFSNQRAEASNTMSGRATALLMRLAA